MQAKIPLFSQPPFKTLTSAVTVADLVTVLDLRSDADQDVTRLVTLYVNYFNETPSGATLNFGVAEVVGDDAYGSSPEQLIAQIDATDSFAGSFKVLDQFPVRGNARILALGSFSEGHVAVFGYYTIAGESGATPIGKSFSTPGASIPASIFQDSAFTGMFSVLDKRPLQPNDEVPTTATFPSSAGDPVHVVPETSPYVDDVTVDICLFGSTAARLYFENYPDDYIGLYPPPAFTDRQSDPGWQRALDSMPFRAEGRLMLTATTAGEDPAAKAVGHFVRY